MLDYILDFGQVPVAQLKYIFLPLPIRESVKVTDLRFAWLRNRWRRSRLAIGELNEFPFQVPKFASN